MLQAKNKCMNEMIDAHAYEMQCKYGSQTPEVLQFMHPISYSKKELVQIILKN
jgi:hypothetical protein